MLNDFSLGLDGLTVGGDFRLSSSDRGNKIIVIGDNVTVFFGDNKQTSQGLTLTDGTAVLVREVINGVDLEVGYIKGRVRTFGHRWNYVRYGDDFVC